LQPLASHPPHWRRANISGQAAIEVALTLSPRFRLMIQQDGRIRLLIEMFLYTTALLADNEKNRLMVTSLDRFRHARCSSA
jgi:hypothetical protein